MDTGIIIAEVARRTGTLLDRDDPMLIVAEVANIVAEGHREELRASIDELRKVVTTAQPRFDADNMQQLGRHLHPQLQLFVDRLRFRTHLFAIGVGMAMLIGAVAGGYWWGRTERGSYAEGYADAESRLATVSDDLKRELSSGDAAVWVALMRNNDIRAATRSCGAQNGRKACDFALWTEPAPLVAPTELPSPIVPTTTAATGKKKP
jgi:hypothetical protein